jgi:hypothetical protein
MGRIADSLSSMSARASVMSPESKSSEMSRDVCLLSVSSEGRLRQSAIVEVSWCSWDVSAVVGVVQRFGAC